MYVISLHMIIQSNNTQVSPDPRFRPCDLQQLGYPVDPRLEKHPIFDSLMNELKPIKKQYEHGMSYDMRR